MTSTAASGAPRGLVQRAVAGDAEALARLQRRLRDGLARSGAVGSGDARDALLCDAYASALDLLPRLAAAGHPPHQDRR